MLNLVTKRRLSAFKMMIQEPRMSMERQYLYQSYFEMDWVRCCIVEGIIFVLLNYFFQFCIHRCTQSVDFYEAVFSNHMIKKL